MKRVIIFSILVIVVLPLAKTFAEIYVFIDELGIVNFTDDPSLVHYKQIQEFSINSVVPEEKEKNKEFSLEDIHKMIDTESLKNNLDPDLVRALVMVESSFNPSAVSKKGAMGLMQLMPRTAKGLYIKDPFNPNQNLKGGIRHLRRLLKRYKGNIDLSLAAYNAGEKAVSNYKGIPPYQETIKYVKKVKQYYKSIKYGNVQPPLIPPIKISEGLEIMNKTTSSKNEKV